MSDKKEENKVLTFSRKNQEYELLGKRFCYKGKKYSAEEALKVPKLLDALVRDKAPAIRKIESVEENTSKDS